MSFTRFVEVGRVAYVAFGPDEGKLVVIVDILDQTRALVDGPCSGVARKIISFKQLHLTKFVVGIARSAREKTVRKAWEKAEITKKWEESSWAKKIANRKLRAGMTDYDRFKLMKAKQARNRLITVEFTKTKKAAKKAKTYLKKKRTNKKTSAMRKAH